MLKSNKFNFVYCAAVSALAVGLAITPANALPGQSVKTVLSWAKTKPQLPTLTYSDEVHSYNGTKGKLHFYAGVTAQNGTVTHEGITISGDSSFKFTKKSARVVKLIQNIYNANIGNDFQKSRYVTKIGRDQFYRGQNYAYIAAEVQGGTNLRIITLNSLQGEINNARYCQTHQCDL
ncbi:MAG: hypothetical protein KME23_02545 [Goleter apudmare HA4340-LM2]|jgi:hypothetical protein|nr:hypothetical protein [Goleter apudmare HA4340-LM2]